MQHSVEKLSGNKVKISFNVPASSFEEAIEKAYLKNRSRINVPGFRKGKAPRKLIQRMYGETIFYDDALDAIFPEAFLTAVKDNDLHPVGRPDVNVENMEEGKELAFSCEVFVVPEVKLGDYKGVSVTRVVRQVTDEEVDARIAQEQKRVARSVEITDRAVQNGDQVNLDYSGTVDGVKFNGGTAQGQSLVIGSGNFIPGFEEQMVGMAIGEERDLTVRFPEKYHSEELQGKEAVFHVKVNSITCEELPTLDDEFASEVSDFDTFAEYRDDLRKRMQEAADEQSTQAAKESMLEGIVKEAEIDIPDPMIEDKLDEMMDQMSWRMQQQGFTLKKYQELTGQTEQQMREMYREEATNALKTELVVEEIIKVEGIQTDEAQVEKMLEEYASASGQSVEQLKSSLREGQMEYFSHRSRINKAYDLLWENAQVKDEMAKAVNEDEQA
ncbi:MAG: trigger factor [Clostridiales bacterium]|nr:trigger factor [Clostridiales bacterium]